MFKSKIYINVLGDLWLSNNKGNRCVLWNSDDQFMVNMNDLVLKLAHSSNLLATNSDLRNREVKKWTAKYDWESGEFFVVESKYAWGTLIVGSTDEIIAFTSLLNDEKIINTIKDHLALDEYDEDLENRRKDNEKN